MTRYLVPKDWPDHQHYKDRDPPWIKLHKKLLTNYEFSRLPVVSKALAPLLWLLASERKDGKITYEVEKIAFRVHMKVRDVEDAIKALLQTDFFTVEHDDSEPLAERKQVATPETEAETQKKTEAKAERTPAVADEITLAVQAYNAVAEETNWPRAQLIDQTRRSKLAKRLTDCGGLEGWQHAMAKARASPFLRGETRRDKAHESWVPDFDFFLQPSTFTKLMEGKYDQRTNNQKPTGLDAIIAGARAAASG